MHTRRLTPDDAAALQALRLTALQECPSAFGSSYEEEVSMPLSVVASGLAPDSGRPKFGAFVGSVLVGSVVVGRSTARKQLHKGYIWGVYVHANHRGQGIARALMTEAVAYLTALGGLRQIMLGVTAGNAHATALYAAFGFVAYGCEPESLCVDGVFYDEVLMALSLVD